MLSKLSLWKKTYVIELVNVLSKGKMWIVSLFGPAIVDTVTVVGPNKGSKYCFVGQSFILKRILLMGGGSLQLIVTSLLLVVHMCPPLVVNTSSLKGNTFWLVKFSHHCLSRSNSDFFFLWHFQETFGQDCHIFCNFKLIANKKNLPLDTYASGWMLWSISSCSSQGNAN
jgi:hypothetical protein